MVEISQTGLTHLLKVFPYASPNSFNVLFNDLRNVLPNVHQVFYQMFCPMFNKYLTHRHQHFLGDLLNAVCCPVLHQPVNH